MAETGAQDDTASTGPEVTLGDPIGAHHALFSREDASFESELRTYVQRRLVLVAWVLGLAGAGLFLIARIADFTNHGWVTANLIHPSVATHFVATVLIFGLYVTLKRRPFQSKSLLGVDTAITIGLVLVCLLIYIFSYRTGVRQLVPLLGLLLIARAIVIPSRPGRTARLSLAAPVGILVIQLAHGTVYTLDGETFPAAGFEAYVLWDQATLWFAVGLAVLTSRVVYALRVQAYEASTVGRYTLESRLGSGAIGQVYLARHALISRPVAVKILRPEIASSRNLELFEQEVQRTSQLTHPNTVHVFDYGLTAEGLFYYAMEYLEGSDLDRIISIGGPMPGSRVIHVLRQALGSLGEAHAKGLIHCDLKPANLVLCRQGGAFDVLKVLDFGLARNVQRRDETSNGLAFGTPLTMSPEVISGQAISVRTDLYSLAAVGYFLLIGAPLFDGKTVGEVLRAHLKTPAPLPSRRARAVPPDLEACLLRCLEKDPEARPASAAEFAAELDACAHARGWTPANARQWWVDHGAEARMPTPSVSGFEPPEAGGATS